MARRRRRITAAQWTLVGLIIGLANAALIYRLLVFGKLEQTAALFIGLPAVMACVVAAAPPAGTYTGSIAKAMTIALLMAGIFLGEGVVCLIMTAPLFYGVAVPIGMVLDHYAKKKQPPSDTLRLRCLIALPLVLMSLEGVHDRLSFPRDEQVTVTRTLWATAAEVEQALAATPRYSRPPPLFLRLGFPRPVYASGAGLRVGDRRTIRFAGGEGEPGDLVLEVIERGPGLVRFHVVKDTSHISHWLAREDVEVRWEEIAPNETRVSWSIRYRRLLDPAWYFGPLERYAVRLSAGYLIDTVATPE